jgi:ATP-dependent DNA helicase RecG
MDQQELQTLLEQLLATWENEVVEFKQAGNDYSTDKIGEYFSALANEANLRRTDSGWLVFGVNNKIANLLSNLRRAGRVCNTGTRKQPVWELAE